MPIPHTILTLCVSAGCWLLAASWIATPRAEFLGADNPLAIRRSGYGSLAARLMKESMHNYWHAGTQESAHGHKHEHGENAASDADELGSTSKSWLQQCSERISEWEAHRKAAPRHFKIRPSHRRYLEATAARYVRTAYHLDPGDSALYEIMHYTEMSRAGSPASAVQVSEKLARETIAHALSPVGGCAAALTGAGAAINLLNNAMQAGAPATASPEQLRQHWKMLSECLDRYHTLKQSAVSEGWWEAIPLERRREIGIYAALIEKLSRIIGRKLETAGVLG
ncbi:MAG: hypothetical protein WCL08_03725 [Verrucomicrobiota bacterium]